MNTYNRHFNFSATAQLIIDPAEDAIIEANQEACRLLQMDLQTTMAQRPSRLFSPSFPGFIAFTQELIERGRGWSDQLQVLSAEEPVHIELTGRYSESGDERLLHLSMQKTAELDKLRARADAHRHYLSGITHWRRVSQVFHEFERENQLLLDAAGEGIYGVDANGNTTFVNPAAERILGYSAEELAGLNMHKMVHHSHADGSHYQIDACPIFAAFRDGSVHRVDNDVFWSKSGEPIDVEYTSTPIRDDNIIVGTVVIFRDVSQKKADRRRLEAALEEVERLKHRLELENAYLQEEINSVFNHHRIVGKSAAIQKTLQQIELVAPTDATVFIHGESGTGKELIARAIHEISPRSQRSLIRVNCAAIPEELFESEFFGHRKGAFTGATDDRAGRFELADGGTLFLDEVGEIPLRLQGKLLRVLQEQQFERVGEAVTRDVNVRIIAATNRDLAALVREGLFREDLYFRLNVFPVESAPLRQRREDIPLLTQHFLKKACQRANKGELKLPLAEVDRLCNYHWPGNIRELENVIERQVILTRGSVVKFEPHFFPADRTEALAESPVFAREREAIASDDELRLQQRQNIIAALKHCNGKVFGIGGAAELLALKPTTLSSRLKKLGIDARQFKVNA
ncbi:sigma-54 interaction domain-containing protein [Haliea sp. E17]|uniref:sigma-54 interaction domain-containing protein n=1 Tax=Haliea sp. E17 TaxID=3401576 RepID=UPI003AAD3427